MLWLTWGSKSFFMATVYRFEDSEIWQPAGKTYQEVQSPEIKGLKFKRRLNNNDKQ